MSQWLKIACVSAANAQRIRAQKGLRGVTVPTAAIQRGAHAAGPRGHFTDVENEE